MLFIVENRRKVVRLRHDDPAALIDPDERMRSPQERFAAAERLITLAFAMKGWDGRVQRHIARIVRRKR